MIGMWIRKFSNRGFTLLEIIICLGLITTGLLAVFSLQAQNLDLQSEAQFITTSHFLSQERLAKIRSDENLLPGNMSGDFGENFPLYRYDEEISVLPQVDNLFKISLRIFLTGEEQIRYYDIVTYLFRAKE